MSDPGLYVGLGVANNIRLGLREGSKERASAEPSMLRVIAQTVL